LWVPITNATIEGDWMNKAGVKGLPTGEAASSFPEIAWTGPKCSDRMARHELARVHRGAE